MPSPQYIIAPLEIQQLIKFLSQIALLIPQYFIVAPLKHNNLQITIQCVKLYLCFINSDFTGGYEDHSELAEAVKEVVRCLSSRAVKPSPLRLTLRILELERVHAILSNQCLTSIADRKMCACS